MLDSHQNNGQSRSSDSIVCSSVHPARTIAWHRRNEWESKIGKETQVVQAWKDRYFNCYNTADLRIMATAHGWEEPLVQGRLPRSQTCNLRTTRPICCEADMLRDRYAARATSQATRVT
jgi:hypothetical protein